MSDLRRTLRKSDVDGATDTDTDFFTVLVTYLLIQKNLRSFITVKAHCSMTHLKQQKSLGFF